MTGPCPKIPCDSVEGGVENMEFEKGKIFIFEDDILGNV